MIETIEYQRKMIENMQKDNTEMTSIITYCLTGAFRLYENRS
jgi:hypothetical protein